MSLFLYIIFESDSYSKEYLVAKIGVDAAEIELLEVHLVFKLRDQIFTDPSRPDARFGRFAPRRTRIRQARTLSVAPRSEELASDACIAGVTSECAERPFATFCLRGYERKVLGRLRRPRSPQRRVRHSHVPSGLLKRNACNTERTLP